ncbi:protein of unknown function [Clostridium botulinum C str. Eklund]|nr:protein of unknown function [Clostridium botulinum C str. Eklund]NEZ48428.1 motility associated factor glycosyltransferase family protein [Clostridium botulinum]
MIANYSFEIEKSKDGYRVIRINKEDKKIYIGSKYSMKERLDRIFYEEKCTEQENIIIFFGIGSGECLNKLYEKYKNGKVVIFEPNINVKKYVLENVSDYDFVENENVYMLKGENEEDLYKELSQIIGEFNVNKITYKWLLNYDKIYEEQLLKFSIVVRKLVTDRIIARNTSMLFHKRWFDTLISNLKYIVKAEPINVLKDKYKDVPAIIVSAGPSLSKNIDELKNIDNDMMILSGGRTLRTLKEKNIEPNLIGVVDPGEVAYKMIEGYIEKTKVPLLFYEGTNEQVVEKHNGSKLYFSQNSIMNDIFEMHIENIGAGGSIAHTLTSAAIFMGCNPIIFIGQDLAYTGEKYHADIAIYKYSNIEANEVKEELEGIYVEDINGELVKTSPVLDNFRRELEKIIENNNNVTFINATEGGAKIKGTLQMTLKDAIKSYEIKNHIAWANDESRLDRQKIKQNAVRNLEEIIEADEQIINQSKKALEIVKKLRRCVIHKEKSKIGIYSNQLDNIDNIIKEKYEELDILKTIIYPTVYNILSGTKPKNDKEIIEKNKYLYESILNISKEVLESIKKAKIDIEKMEI